MHTLVVQGSNTEQTVIKAIAERTGGSLAARKHFHLVRSESPISSDTVQALRASYDLDVNLLPQGFDPREVRLLITDMDSTFINIECVDEIADFCGLKAQVAEITEAAMRGELDFAQSLTRRVGLLKGLDASALEHVYRERLRLNPGGEIMLDGLRSSGIKVALVSGGFTFFTERLRKKYGLFAARANTLEIIDDTLTGRVLGDIVGAEAKANFLQELCAQQNIALQQIVAMGDGANDLTMMKLAGLSIAYHAKPKVQAAAHTALNHCGLDGVLGLLDVDMA